MDERERQKLIEKLGTAKTSEERDRILRKLASEDKTAPGEPQRAEATDVGKSILGELSGKTQARLSPGRRSIILLVTAIFGLYLIVEKGMKIIQGQWGLAEIIFLVLGCVFLSIAISDLFKGKRAKEKAGRETDKSPMDGKPDEEMTEGKTRARPSPGMKALILLMMVFGGLYLITNAVMSIMQGRWGAFEIIMLIQGFAFLSAAIFIFLKERAKENAGQGD